MVTVSVIGLPPLQNRLRTMVSPEKIELALDKSAALVEYDAKHLVRVKTGRLKNSINTFRTGKFKRSIGSNVEYAAIQEFGTADKRPYGYTPYLRPAARKNKAKIMKIMKDTITKR